MVVSSRRKASMAFFIWISASFKTSSVMVFSFDQHSGYRSHKRADLFATGGPSNVALLLEVEDDQRDAILHAERQGCGVHDPQIALEGQAVIERAVPVGGRVQAGVVVVDSVDGIL